MTPAWPAALAAITTMLVALGAPRIVRAESPDSVPLPGRFEVAAGVSWLGRTSIGSANANEQSRGGSLFPLFSTTTELALAAGAEARIGVALTDLVQVEVSGSYMRPELRTSIGRDAENALPVIATERTSQLTVDGALVLHLTRWRMGGRAVPFVAGGIGYLRQLHQGHTLLQTGRTYRAGIGVKYLLASNAAARLKGIGVSAEVRLAARSGGVTLDGRTHVSPALAASLFVRF